MIETLKEQLRLSLHRQFCPRNEAVNVDQLGLFALAGNEDSAAIQIDVGMVEKISSEESIEDKLPVERKKAIRMLKDLPHELRIIDIQDSEKCVTVAVLRCT